MALGALAAIGCDSSYQASSVVTDPKAREIINARLKRDSIDEPAPAGSSKKRAKSKAAKRPK